MIKKKNRGVSVLLGAKMRIVTNKKLRLHTHIRHLPREPTNPTKYKWLPVVALALHGQEVASGQRIAFLRRTGLAGAKYRRPSSHLRRVKDRSDVVGDFDGIVHIKRLRRHCHWCREPVIVEGVYG